MPEQDKSAKWFYKAMPAPPSDSQMPTNKADSPPLASLDNVYKKALLKGNIKIDKLTEHICQKWNEIIELYLSAKVLFDKIDGSIFCPDKALRFNNYKAWKFDDTQAQM